MSGQRHELIRFYEAGSYAEIAVRCAHGTVMKAWAGNLPLVSDPGNYYPPGGIEAVVASQAAPHSEDRIEEAARAHKFVTWPGWADLYDDPGCRLCGVKRSVHSSAAAPQGEDPRVERYSETLTFSGAAMNEVLLKVETLRRENAELRESNTLLNRRATRAEAIVAQRVEEQERKGKSLGRSLANAGYYALKAENAKLREALEEYQRGQECDYGPSDKPCPGTPDFAPCLFHRARAALDPSSTGTK